ncbi:MAG: phosphoribosylamine--glycine ligase [Nanoarchaeota archaeon]|nr:phosphoribosylamine--glycine ligase [Nanoarchaeota archaeon]
MAKFLIITQAAYINDLAWRVSLGGHQVKYHVGYKPYKNISDGFLDKVEDWKGEIDWADVIVIDAGFKNGSRISEELRAKGKKVIGGTRYTDRLEDDRAFGQAEMARKGIPIISLRNFSDAAEAVSYIRSRPRKYVYKPDGDSQEDKSLLCVGESAEGKDIIELIEKNAHKVKKFQLQDKVEGVEIGATAFFNGKEFLRPLAIGFEHKRLFPGNIGPSTIEMGTSVLWREESEMFDNILKKFQPELEKCGYVGCFDINCIINAEGIQPLEFTPRFGYPMMGIIQDSLDMDTGDFLYRFASGESFHIKTRPGFHIGVRIVMPPYPYHCKKVFEEYSRGKIIRIEGSKEGIHIEDVNLVNNEWVVSGEVGGALLVCGSGRTMAAAIEQAYGRISRIVIPNMYYRNDIGAGWSKEIKKLHEWGYLLDLD